MADDVIKDFNEQAAEEAEVRRKQRLLTRRRTELDFKRLEESDEQAERSKTISFAAPSPEDIARYQRDNEEYMAAAREGKVFINQDFSGVVPFFRKNLILVGAVSGEGKTTCAANLTKSAILQGMRGIVFTNEERSEDFYNRVTSLLKKWPYTNHNSIPPERVPVYTEFIARLAPRLTVVDDSYGGTSGTTTTLEGMTGALDQLLREYRETEESYGFVVLEYYQNVSRSRDNNRMEPWQVMEQLARRLDEFKNAYPAPVVVMAQLMPGDKDGKTPFKHRVEGRKSILNPATCALEVRADRKMRRTEWVIHKSRYTEAMGQSFFTGYDRGEYVRYTPEFAMAAEQRALMRGVFKGKDGGDAK